MDVCVSAAEGVQKRGKVRRTNEPTWVLFTCFCARTNIAYSFDVGCRKAKLVALEYDEAILDVKAESGYDIVPIRVVICVLYKLE
jgi:hypothetical protein